MKTMAVLILIQSANLGLACWADSNRYVMAICGMGLGWLLGLYFSMREIERYDA